MGTLLGSFSGTNQDQQSGGAGTNFKAGSANIQQPTTADQVNAQYANANNALSQQQAFTNAVQAQNGLGNQTAVYNQLAGIANGTGPNPALAQLNQTTGQNVSNQAALMAGQRGSSSNAGLIARQAAQQGANTQQQAVGQGATLAANQQLNAINGMGSIATNQANQQANAVNAYTNATQGEQGQVLGGVAAQNNALVGNSSGMNSANAAVSGHTADGQQGLFGGISSGVSSLGSLFAHGGMVQKFADGGMAQPLPIHMFADGGIASTPLNQSQGATSGPSSTLGKMLAGIGQPGAQQSSPSGASSMQAGSAGLLPLAIKGGQALYNNIFSSPADGPSQWGTTASGYQNALSGSTAPEAYESAGSMAGGAGDAALGAEGAADAGGIAGLGEAGEAADLVALAYKGGAIQHPNPHPQLQAQGGHVPGTAKVPGDSIANDTVNAKLSPGEIVIPRHITQGPNAPAEAAKFVAQVIAKQKRKGA